MDFVQLNIFISLAQTLNFSRTAEIFFLTQPAVSHQIKMLERSLGATLLERNKRNVALTSEGQAFLTYAVQMIDMAQNAKNRIKNISEGRTGHIRIAALSSTTLILSECLAIFSKRYPLIQVDINILEGSDFIDAFNKNNVTTPDYEKYDFFFMTKAMLPKVNQYKYTITGNYQLHLYVHCDDAAFINMSDWSTIEKYPFVSVSQSEYVLTKRIEEIFKNRGCSPRIVNYYNRAESVIISVNAQIGVAILPPSLAHIYYRPNVVTLPIEGEDAYVSSIIACNKETLSAAAIKFDEVVNQLFN